MTIRNEENVLRIINFIDKSVKDAENGVSKIPEDILSLKSMSRTPWKKFMNILCSEESGFSNYLEIGTWLGGALASTVYGNKNLTTYVIDNFCEFVEYNNKNEFNKNMLMVKDTCGGIFHLEKDAFGVDVKEFAKNINGKIDVYFYDAGHKYEDQYRAFSYYNDILADTFVAIVDDFNHARVINGTFDAFRDLDYKIHKIWSLEENDDGNIFFIALISKNKNP